MRTSEEALAPNSHVVNRRDIIVHLESNNTLSRGGSLLLHTPSTIELLGVYIECLGAILEALVKYMIHTSFHYFNISNLSTTAFLVGLFIMTNHRFVWDVIGCLCL